MRDSTSQVQTFLSSIFGGTKEEVTTKKQVYLDDNGTIIRIETEPVDNDEDLELTEDSNQDDSEKDNTKKGFFSFLKRKNKDEDN